MTYSQSIDKASSIIWSIFFRNLVPSHFNSKEFCLLEAKLQWVFLGLNVSRNLKISPRFDFTAIGSFPFSIHPEAIFDAMLQQFLQAVLMYAFVTQKSSWKGSWITIVPLKCSSALLSFPSLLGIFIPPPGSFTSATPA